MEGRYASDEPRYGGISSVNGIGGTAYAVGYGGMVYIGGKKGTLLEGRSQHWEIIEHETTTDTIWEVEWFVGELYASTMANLHRRKRDVLEPIDFGADRPKTFYHLSVEDGVLWSAGEKDIVSFDGTSWTRVV